LWVRHFGGIYHFYLQAQRTSQARNQQRANLLLAGFLLDLLFELEDGGDTRIFL
jgi:hypothetical protein